MTTKGWKQRKHVRVSTKGKAFKAGSTKQKIIEVSEYETGLYAIHEIMKAKGKDKPSFWRPIYEELKRSKDIKGLAIGSLDVYGPYRTFSKLIDRLEEGASHYFPPIASSYERFGQLLTMRIGKKLNVKVIQR
jgi:hypothetical protein